MNYPTIEQVEAADQYQLCRWYRFLEPTTSNEQVEIITEISKRIREGGGLTSEISKEIGWTE